jgi:hypothetical protein
MEVADHIAVEAIDHSKSLNSSGATILQLLEGDDPPLEAILVNPTLPNLFKSQPRVINPYFENPRFVERLLTLFRTSTDSIMIASIAALFLSQNPILLGQFSQNVNIIEWCSHVIFSLDSSDYLLGLLSRIIEAACQRFALKFYNLLNSSPAFWSACLLRLNRPVVAEICTILLQSPTPSDHSFLWGYFLAILDDHREAFHPPPGWSAAEASIRTCRDVPLTTAHHISMLKLFQMFISSFPDEDSFIGSLFLSFPYLAKKMSKSEAELCAFFDLTVNLPVQECVINLALSVLARDPVRPTNALEKALVYVTTHFCLPTLRIVVPFLVRAVLSGVSNNFLFQRIRELIAVMLECDDIDPMFFTALQHLVAFAWNRKGPNCPLVRRAFLLELADLCTASPSFGGWTMFVTKVVKHYRARRPAPEEFEVPENEMDPHLLHVLQGPAELEDFVAHSLGPTRPRSLTKVAITHSSPSLKLGMALGANGKKGRRARKSGTDKKRCGIA